jgi:hypothetical protein
MSRIFYTASLTLVAMLLFTLVTHSTSRPAHGDVPVVRHTLQVAEALVANGEHVVVGEEGRFGPFTTCSQGTLLLQIRSLIRNSLEPTTFVLRLRTESEDVSFEIDLMDGPLTAVGSVSDCTKWLHAGDNQRLFKGGDAQTVLLNLYQGKDWLPFAEKPVTIEGWWMVMKSVPALYSTPSANVGALKVKEGTETFTAPQISLSYCHGSFSCSGQLVLSLNHNLRFVESPELKLGEYYEDWEISHRVDDQGRLVITGVHKTHDYAGDFYLNRLHLTGAVVAGADKLAVGTDINVSFRLSEEVNLTEAQTIAQIVAASEEEPE